MAEDKKGTDESDVDENIAVKLAWKLGFVRKKSKKQAYPKRIQM